MERPFERPYMPRSAAVTAAGRPGDVKLQHLISVDAIVKHEMSVTRAAASLNTSQPALSTHVQALEAELRTELFVRQRNRFVSLSPSGELLLPIIARAVDAVDELKRTAREVQSAGNATLTVAASQTIARYMLPPLIERFSRAHPKMKFRLCHGTMPQLISMVAAGEADLSLSTRPKDLSSDLVTVPCFDLGWQLLTKQNHPLLRLPALSLEALAAYPVITYTEAFVSHGVLLNAFEAKGLRPNFTLLEADSDIIKRYARAGLGIAIIKDGAFDAELDKGLDARSLSGLLPETPIEVGVRRNSPLSKAALTFLNLVRPGLAAAVRKQLLPLFR